MRIGLFGGAFDPFHKGHRAICRAALKELGLDRLIVIPTWDAPHKSGFTASYEDRCNMAALGTENLNVCVSRYEYERGGRSYSAITAEYFKEQYPDDELYFIIGGDSYRDLDTWYQPWRITACATLAVYPRSDAEIEVKPPAVEFRAEKHDISGTELRRRLNAGEAVSAMVPEKVWEYIKEKKLYEN